MAANGATLLSATIPTPSGSDTPDELTALADGPNRVDNVEVVDAPTAAGTWKVEVMATQLAVGGKQKFALIATGLKESGH